MKNLAFIFIFWIVLSNNQTFSQMWKNDMTSLMWMMGNSEKNPITVKRGVFIYRNSDSEKLEDLENVLRKAWQVSELLLMSKDEFNDYSVENGDVVFYIKPSLSGSLTTYSNGTSTQSCIFRLELSVNYYSGIEDSIKPRNIGAAHLQFEQQFAVDACGGKKSLEQISSELYYSGEICNWDLTYLGNFVGLVSKKIEDSAFHGMSKSDASISNLKTSTLYISEGVNIDVNKFKSKNKLVDKTEIIDKAYNYPHQIVTKEQLDQFAIEGKEAYVLYAANTGTFTKYLIFDLRTGKVVLYRSGYKFNVTSKDFKRIVKYINNPNKK